MKKILLLASLLALALAFSCTKEIQDNSPEVTTEADSPEATIMVFKASLPETKVYLGEKGADGYPTLWQAGDVISVNGNLSAALEDGDGFVGTNYAQFSISGTSSAPYYSASPASAISGYSAGAATVTVPAQQTYVAGQHDPAAYIMLGTSNSTLLSFNPMMSLFKITPTAPAEGSLNITSVKLEALGTEKMSGAFTTDFSSLSGGENNYVEVAAPSGGIPFGTPITLAIPAQNYASGLRFVISASDGTTMAFSRTSAFTAAASTLYPITAPAYVPSAVTITGHWSVNSSVITLRWHGSNPANDSKKPWRIHVYTDSACASEFASYDLPASAEWIVGEAPRFAIAGLAPGTDYWFKVEDPTSGAMSDPVAESTKAFTVVPMPTSDITAPAVVYAEDFGEYAWGTDYVKNGVGFIPSDQSSFSNRSLSGATINPDEKDFRSTGNFSTAIANSRLADWLSEGKVYIHPGYLKLGTSSTYGFALTPEFPIEDGKTALADVTVSFTKYNADQSDDFMVCVVSEDGDKGGRQSDFTWPDVNDASLYRVVSTAKHRDESSPWETVTVSGMRLQRGDRIAFGRTKSGSNSKARVLFDDISVEVKALSNSSFFAFAAEGATSSTLPFSWSGDPSHAFTASLYSDAACTAQVASFDIPASDACWSSSQPKFVFGGLTPATTYYLKVADTTDSIESNVASATTEAFSIVPMPASITSTGVALAEDFGELLWHSDMLSGAAGFVPNTTSSFSSTDVKNYVAGNSTAGEVKMTTTAPLASSRLADWAYDSNVYYHCGYLKMGKSDGKGWILTPQFTVPEGKKAIVNVTVTAAKYNSSQENSWGIAVLNADEANVSGYAANFSWPAGGTSDKYQTVALGTEWTTVTAEGLTVLPGDRITFGAAEGSSSSKGRVFISDIKVEVTAIEDVPIRVSVLERTSSTLAFTWNEGGAENTDNQIGYTATLYSDAECTTPVQSYTFPSGSAGQTLWRSGKYPKFIFAGLEQNTPYFLKVIDGSNQESEVIAAKTLAFTVVTMPSSITEPGVVLAEDFSLFVWDFEYGTGSVGLEAPSSPSSFTDRGTTPVKFSESNGAYQLFTSSAFASSRLNKWARDAGTDARVMIHPGYVTLGTFSNNQKAWILTPPFPVPEGKVATVTITLTVRKGKTSCSGKHAVGILSNTSNSGANGGGANMQNENTSDFSWPNDRPATIYNNFTVASDDVWETKTYKNMLIRKDDRVVVGAQASTSYSSSICCLNLSDIKVEVTAVNDEGTPENINVGI
ncbi:MAG: hypothetical protein IKR69_07455 [Bacteroidales bacterium]|nr:hypothetical protein [Bacteroidales bacterium]